MSLNRIIAIFSIILLVIVAFVGFQFSGKLRNQFAPPAAQKVPTTKIIVNDAEFLVDVATTSAERQKGLSGRSSLENNQGMLFVFDTPGYHGFWMRDMKIAIDMIFINDDKIVSFVENVQPPTEENQTLPVFTPESPADKVLELNAGSVQNYSLKKGDTVTIEPDLKP